ncbi:MAG: hypothetical protein ACI90M_003505 [Candidatus Azotimanducaceae bacterium]
MAACVPAIGREHLGKPPVVSTVRGMIMAIATACER